MRHLALGMLTIVAVACGQNSPPIQATVRVQADSTRNGRYQVVTTPQTVQTNQTMLLDTQTGQTWLLCDVKKIVARDELSVPLAWCRMAFYGTVTGAPKP